MVFILGIHKPCVRRRKLLEATGTAIAVGIAGCNSENAESPTPTTTKESDIDPELRTPITEFWAAFNDEDAQDFIDAYHPNSPYVPSREDISFGNEVSANNFTLVERSSDSATVQVNATVRKDSGENEQVVHTYELRPNDGEWDIYIFVVGSELPDTGTETSDDTDTEAPSVSFQTDYQENLTEGTATGILTMAHDGGDNLNASNIYIRGNGIVAVEGATPDVTSPNTQWAAATGDQEVFAGGSITVGVEADFDIYIVWESSGMSSVLATSSGSTE